MGADRSRSQGLVELKKPPTTRPLDSEGIAAFGAFFWLRVFSSPKPYPLLPAAMLGERASLTALQRRIMIICPWCGTNYLSFQSNCTNCGGAIPAPIETPQSSSEPQDHPPAPPPAPRPISDRYIWRLLYADGWAIAVFVLGLLGVIFTLVSAWLTLGVITAFVGIPLMLMGIFMLSLAVAGFIWRYQRAQKIVNVLRLGEAASAQIVEVWENYSVRVNGRHPWVIRYQFQLNGKDFEGNVTTYNPVGKELQPGQPVSVLYLPDDPQWNSIYPHP